MESKNIILLGQGHSANSTENPTARESDQFSMDSLAAAISSQKLDPVRSKYSADPQVSIVQQVVTVTANRSQPWLSPNVFPLCA